jgi:antitoxin VapB
LYQRADVLDEGATQDGADERRKDLVSGAGEKTSHRTPGRHATQELADVYTWVYICMGRRNMTTARVFKSGNSQAVRLPKKFRVKSQEVEIFRRGDEIVLREKAGGMVRVLDLLAEMPPDMFPKKRKDPRPQRRKGL